MLAPKIELCHHREYIYEIYILKYVKIENFYEY